MAQPTLHPGDHATAPVPPPRRKRSLTAMEVAEAAALADVAAAICVLSRILPIAGAAMLVASIPFAVLGIRRRLRVCVLATVIGWIVGLLFGGYTAANMVGAAAIAGCFAGIAIRRRWSPLSVVVRGIVVIGIPSAALTTGLLAVFASYREFVFENIRNGTAGTARIFANAGIAQVEDFDAGVRRALEVWPITIAVVGLVGAAGGALLTAVFVWRPAQSIARRLGDIATDDTVADAGAVAPVPLHARGVTVVHPGSTTPTIAGVDLDVLPGSLVAVVGHNGAGKSTLARVVSGRAPTHGDVWRPGSAGLGMPGGTAMIGQRPETSVLALAVGDDLAWGVPDMTPERSREVLDRVGLDLDLDAETARLSGGQLQRLAVASALVRAPGLLVSDESTAMIDGRGRADLMGLYRGLANDGTAVVHVTHDPVEMRGADAVIALPGGTSEPAVPVPDQGGRWLRGGEVRVENLSFAHDSGTPWDREVLRDVSMTVAPGQTVLVTGANGSGKTTLARLLAGIEKPVHGTVTVDGEPVRNDRTCALYGQQFARLSLVRSRVRDDICDAAGVDHAQGRLVWQALRELGLDPAQVAEARIDHLSVGQQRRVALAGLLAARPRVLVLDEPLAGLDTASRHAMVAALYRVRASGTTLVIVTHDETELTQIADRVVEVSPLPALPDARPTGKASRASLVSAVGRVLPQTSPAKRLWVGTKVFAIVATAAMLGWNPSWTTVGAAAALAVVWTLAGRVSFSALPRLPWWVPVVALAGGTVTAMGGGAPYVTVADVRLGLGGASTFGILISITVVSLYLSLLFCWTTPMVEVPAFLQRMVGWFARLRIPVQPVAVGVTVALRLLPFMLTDFRALLQTIAQRRTPGPQSFTQRAQQWSACLPIVCSLAVQNAREVATSLDNRGGVGTVARRDRRPGVLDIVVILAILALTVGCGVVVGARY
ncbi:DUF2232 domain-containing protein [Williamsia deligens]|uniref:DUF2232 domain-containing protein n=1 Tax=Williamsia deligens TaxID=321325 RepID=A0ABW3G6B5_9NOCA|nr:DUF2232 domain-containing protein [Williamsia deligens]MCP2193565.1 energy-coupling factor transport system ATP-binding protein [Williamsia deligens]